VQWLVRRLEERGLVPCSLVAEAGQPFVAVLLRELFPNRSIVVVTEGLKAQETFLQDATTWLQVAAGATAGRAASDQTGHAQPLFYPSWEILPDDTRLPHVDVISERLDTLVHLLAKPAAATAPPLIVTSIVALLQRTFPRETLQRLTRTVKRGERIEPLDLIEFLEDQGYEPEAQVTQKGTISLRGGIVDIYPLTSPWPVRLEFVGDEVESIRFFDPLTQVSREAVESATIPPAGELGFLKKARIPGTAGPVVKWLEDAQFATLLDYLPAETVLLICRPDQVQMRGAEYAQQVDPGDPFFVAWEDFQRKAVERGMTLLELSELERFGEDRGNEEPPLEEPPAPALPGDPCSLDLIGLHAFRPLNAQAPDPEIAALQRREFFDQLHRWSRQGYAVHVFCNNDGERQRFQEIWDEYGLKARQSSPPPGDGEPPPTADRPAQLSIVIGTLARGFLFDEAKLVVVTDAEIFGRYKVQRPRRLKSPHALAARSALDIDFSNLEPGDYVVHLQHGIGRYLGLQVLPIGVGTKPTEGGAAQANAGQECLVIEYAPGDTDQAAPKLYVPVTEAHLVSKYVGAGKAQPPLNTLSGTRWAKAKAHAERAIRDLAADLLEIQAARESQVGHSFGQDTTWQREFEGAFIYEETTDQMRAIQETKADMERPKPMDRLICGDVGFGKTEVAIRAAFKAVMGGKQVAILVPTTVLAQQHFNTFRERMADYPVRIELLSRFRSARAQQRVIRELAAGTVDIVIGTHRLIQSDVVPKELGLVVIDEEQRFGVLHKEKFKLLRKLVDVLTLSATPIPRTLYLALTGARDMSTIQTPPHDRLPVETIVTQYDERVIRDAIQRELNRGGQVFFLHNRVATIDTVAQKLMDLLPDARIVVGHGQMHSDDLEEVMTRFVNGEADVLLSTTIIESGLDIPNANTIIIDRADRFGLSDLYQLRGRVGRYKHQAYAYLLLPRHAGLVADARKRLSAIKQYSSLGSGFKIAMRDLEIRGAGNLLGAEQSGHITAVGFDLYCQLLKQSIAALKGEKVQRRVEVQIHLDFLALSPVQERPLPEPSRRSAGLIPGTIDELDLEDMAAAARQETPSDGGRSARRAILAGHASQRYPTAAYIPFDYIADSRQRIEIYRKLAQAGDQTMLKNIVTELRDRFGPLPPALQLLMEVMELKILSAALEVSEILVRDDKVMITRCGNYVMIGTKFPRLTRKESSARLKEIRKLLLAFTPQSQAIKLPAPAGAPPP
jgi:transcription-repair coupling factor (superfamily II helicase)